MKCSLAATKWTLWWDCFLILQNVDLNDQRISNEITDLTRNSMPARYWLFLKLVATNTFLSVPKKSIEGRYPALMMFKLASVFLSPVTQQPSAHWTMFPLYISVIPAQHSSHVSAILTVWRKHSWGDAGVRFSQGKGTWWVEGRGVVGGFRHTGAVEY